MKFVAQSRARTIEQAQHAQHRVRRGLVACRWARPGREPRQPVSADPLTPLLRLHVRSIGKGRPGSPAISRRASILGAGPCSGRYQPLVGAGAASRLLTSLGLALIKMALTAEASSNRQAPTPNATAKPCTVPA